MREVIFGRRAILTKLRPGEEELLAFYGLKGRPEGVVYVLRDGAGQPQGLLVYKDGEITAYGGGKSLVEDGKNALMREVEGQ